MTPDVSFAAQLEAWAHRARLYAAIAECAQRFAETSDLYNIIRDAVLIIRNDIGLDRVGIYLYDETAGCFTGAFGTDTDGSLRDERNLVMTEEPKNPMRRALAGEGDEFFTEDFSQAMPHDTFMRGVRNHFFVVLRAHGRMLGAISVDNLLSQRPVTEDIREDLRRFARYIALAIENFRLGERLEEKNRALTAELEHRNRLLAELDRANSELRDFAHIVSHDLKAPLRGIRSLSQWVLEDFGGTLPQEGRDKLSLIVQRARRMHELIEGILRYSRVGTMQVEKVELEPGAVARRVVEGLGVPPAVQVIIEEPMPRVVYDATQLEQLFQNLIGNALQHMGRAEGHIRIGACARGDVCEFFVSDDGVGIDPRHRERIFRIFQVVRIESDGGSTGIGLAIVKKIVEGHGGRVWVDSQPGRGSTFLFTVPIAGLVASEAGEKIKSRRKAAPADSRHAG